MARLPNPGPLTRRIQGVPRHTTQGRSSPKRGRQPPPQVRCVPRRDYLPPHQKNNQRTHASHWGAAQWRQGFAMSKWGISITNLSVNTPETQPNPIFMLPVDRHDKSVGSRVVVFWSCGTSTMRDFDHLLNCLHLGNWHLPHHFLWDHYQR